jgi:hypothetical protein
MEYGAKQCVIEQCPERVIYHELQILVYISVPPRGN